VVDSDDMAEADADNADEDIDPDDDDDDDDDNYMLFKCFMSRKYTSKDRNVSMRAVVGGVLTLKYITSIDPIL
jgi:hypothetical protein